MDMAKLIEFRVNLLKERGSSLKHSVELVRGLEEAAIAVRQEIIKMTSNANSGHLGGSLSCVDILVALYFHHLKHDPRNPSWPGRDRFVLSKGHAAPVLYATLALSGYFPREELKTFRDIADPNPIYWRSRFFTGKGLQNCTSQATYNAVILSGEDSTCLFSRII